MKKAVYIAVLLLPVLTACGVSPKNPTPAVLEQTQRIYVEPELLVLCDSLDKFSGTITADQLAIEYIQLVEKYGICANRQQKSVEALRNLTNNTK